MPQQKIIRLVTTNDRGYPIGESHHRAKFSNETIDRILELRDQGWTFLRLAREFGISRSHLCEIASGKKRCQTIENVKKVVRLIEI